MKTKHIIKSPKWLLDTIKLNRYKLPTKDLSHSDAVQYTDYAFSSVERIYNSIDYKRVYLILTADEFKERSNKIIKDVIDKDISKKINPNTLLTKYAASFWKDQPTIAECYCNLIIVRGMHLIKNFVRASRVKDYFGMSIASRSILELGVLSAELLKMPMHVITQIGEQQLMPKDIDKYNFIEESLLKSIWGSRIGTGDLGDGNHKKSKPSTPLYSDEHDYSENNILAKNIISAFKQRSRNIENGGGISEYRIYEILCDVVHPSGLGYQLLMSIDESTIGEININILKNTFNIELADFISTAAAFGAYQGACLIKQVHERLNHAIPLFNEVINKNADNTDPIINNSYSTPK